MSTEYLVCVAGLVLLYVSAEGVVRGSARLAAVLGIGPLVVGLTVVAFGTSAPEMVVSLLAAFDGQTAISLGNIIGSNIANAGLVIGVAALFGAIPAGPAVLKRDMPTMMGVMILYWILAAHQDRIGPIDGVLLTAGIVAYCVWCTRRALAPGRPLPARAPSDSGLAGVVVRNGLMFLAGLAGISIGGHLLVKSATAIATSLGIAQWVIGVTLVALGTSLPEMATSIVAAFRGEPELALGNAVGSNIFNVLFVQGSVALVGGGVPVAADQLRRDFPFMVGLCALLYLLLSLKRGVRRWEGGLLLAAYLFYLFLLT